MIVNELAKKLNEKLLNGGSALVLMGAQWLYLWTFPWRGSYLADPNWGHNYVMSLAFLAVGLAYFSRRLLTDILAVLAAMLVISASLSLFPHTITFGISIVLVVLILIDMVVERREVSRQSGSTIVVWLRKYLLCFAYVFLVSIVPSFFLIELVTGSCDADIDTILFNVALLPFIGLLLAEKLPFLKNKVLIQRLGFFWGMTTMIVILLLMTDQPETWPNLVFSVIVTLIGAIALFVNKDKFGDH